MILCCGEALIDFLPANGTEGKTAFQPFNGGAVFNVAIALGRMGRPVGFLGGLSTDFFGQQPYPRTARQRRRYQRGLFQAAA